MRQREHMLAFGFTEQSLDLFPIGAEIGGQHFACAADLAMSATRSGPVRTKQIWM